MKLEITYKDYVIKVATNSVRVVEIVKTDLGKVKLDKKNKPVERSLGYVKDVPEAIQRITLEEIAKKHNTIKLEFLLHKFHAIKEELYNLLR